MLRPLLAISLVLLSMPPNATLAATAKAPHVEVEYSGITDAQAGSIANTLSAARQVYVDRYGFDMPETIRGSVTCGPKETTRLYNDGADRVVLTIPSQANLAASNKSGTFNLYGLCHEVGHLAMYRVLKDRDWMTGAAAEGWAHWAGSVVVDEVYKAKGEKLWAHDPYDYRVDGTKRLDAQLAARGYLSGVARAAGQWKALEGIVGAKGMLKLFEAWQANPPAVGERKAMADALGATLDKTFPEQKEKLDAWWKATEVLFVEEHPASGFAKVEAEPKDLENRPVTLKGDDDSPDGKKSVAGGGHARRFEAPGDGEWFLRSVSVHGSRYGAKQTTDDFEITLCDEQMKPIATWKKPYTAFGYGKPGWAKLDVTPPVRTPRAFYVCLNFRPTATKGVFVDIDSSTSGASRTTPGEMGSELANSDWMIRVEVVRSKGSDPLGGK
jgi:hypothetical protein